MAKIRPIKGLDIELENIGMTKAETIIIRDEAIDKVEFLSLQEKIYSTIKRITMALGFSVKEVQFCKRMIQECEDISQKDFPEDELESIEKDRQDYINRENEANKKIVSKAIELNKEIDNLKELKNHKSKYLTEEVSTALEKVIKEINEFKSALEIDDIQTTEIENYAKNDVENDDFVDLETFLGIPNNEPETITEKVLNEHDENTPMFEGLSDQDVEALNVVQPEVTTNMFDNLI